MDMSTPSLLRGNRRLLSCLSLLLGILTSTVLLGGVRDDSLNLGLVIHARAAELRGSPSTENESSVNPEVGAPPKPENEEISSEGSRPEFPTTSEYDSAKTNVQETSEEGSKQQETAEVSSSDQQTASEQPVANGSPETSSEASMTEDSGYYAQESSEQDYSGDEIYERTGAADDEADYEQWVTAFDIPEQLRKRIEGDDPMYYNLILEERLYLMDAHTDEGEGGAHKQAEDPNSLLVAKKNGVYAVCYARTEEDIWDRCAHAAEAAEGIYIQMQDMTDFGRMVDPDEGVDPSTVKAALTEEHYTRSLRDLGKSWFNNIKDMKDMTGLKVAGIWFGPPDYDKIDTLLKKYPDVFDGIYVDWEDGVGACVDKLTNPPRTTSTGETTAWAENLNFFFRYYMGGQDSKTCLLEDQSPYSFDTYVRAEREMKVPEEWVPAFPCFAGHQGRCYRAFRKNIASACDPSQQRFMFAPYERTSDKLLTMFKEGCRGLGYEAPPQYDIVQYV